MNITTFFISFKKNIQRHYLAAGNIKIDCVTLVKLFEWNPKLNVLCKFNLLNIVQAVFLMHFWWAMWMWACSLFIFSKIKSFIFRCRFSRRPHRAVLFRSVCVSSFNFAHISHAFPTFSLHKPPTTTAGVSARTLTLHCHPSLSSIEVSEGGGP